MQIAVNIEKRHAFVIGALLLIAVAIGVVYAVAPNPGHTASELDGVCTLATPLNCPVSYTGNKTYLEPATSYTYDDCQATCNAQVFHLDLGPNDPVPTCINYQNPISSYRYNCADADQNIVLCHIDPAPFSLDTTYPTYHCATRMVVDLQPIGDQIQIN